MIKTADKFYTKFNPEERLDLALAALARDDQIEYDNLRATCPWKAYNCIDFRFSERAESLDDIVIAFLAHCNAALKELGAYMRMRILLLQDAEEETRQNLIVQNKEFIDQCIISVQSAREALRLFCGEAHLNHDHLFEWILRFWYIKADDFIALGQLFFETGSVFDSEIVRNLKDGFLNLWLSR